MDGTCTTNQHWVFLELTGAFPSYHLLKRHRSEVLRTYSTSVLWGREVAENSAVAPLFNYLPQAGVLEHHVPRRVP